MARKAGASGLINMLLCRQGSSTRTAKGGQTKRQSKETGIVIVTHKNGIISIFRRKKTKCDEDISWPVIQ